MIIVKIRGGLGNQIFQYVFGSYMRLKYPDIPVLFDMTLYNREEIHNGYELNHVFDNINIAQASSEDLKKCHVYYEDGSKSLFRKICRKIERKRYRLLEKENKKNFTEFEWTKFSDIEQQQILRHSDIYFEGDWTTLPYYKLPMRSYKSFLTFKESLLSKSEQFIRKEIRSGHSVSIHIRGGDYIGSAFEFVPREYYLKAIEIMQKKMPDTHFLIFSDDVKYARSLLGDQYTYVEGNGGKDSWKDMYLMSECNANIITNSTFGFWAAVLNKHRDKIIIAPNLNSKVTEYYLPYDDSWIVI